MSSQFCQNPHLLHELRSISEGSLLWDVSCYRETKGVNCYVSH